MDPVFMDMYLTDILKKKICLIWEYESANRKLHCVCHAEQAFWKQTLSYLAGLPVNSMVTFVESFAYVPKCILIDYLEKFWL